MIEAFVRQPSGDDGKQITFTKLELVLRFNAPSSWSIEIPTSDAAVQLAEPGAGIIVERDGVILLSGFNEDQKRSWSSDEDGTTTDQFIISGVSDEGLLWDRLVYPSAPITTTTTTFPAAGYYNASGPAETVMKELVGANTTDAGWSRFVFDFSIAPDMVRGDNVVVSSRFDVMGDVLQSLGSSGGLGFNVIDRVFDVYEPVDRTDTAVFGPELGNLRAFEYTVTAPTANSTVVGGQGEDVAREFVLGNDAVSQGLWSRTIEQFIDQRQTNDVVELTQASDEALVNGASTTSLSITPIELDSLRFGRDYNLGDLVTVSVDGTDIVDIVREVAITVDGNGELLVPTVESASGSSDVLGLFGSLRELRGRTSALERKH